MDSFILLLISIAVLIFVMEPFFSTRKLPNRFVSDNQVQKNNLLNRKENIQDMIRTLDLENSTNMITSEDYQKLSKIYNAKLKLIKDKLDSLGSGRSGSNIRNSIEEDIKTLRKTSGSLIAEVKTVACEKCSTENLPDSNFCSKCGNKLS
ncbi:zinc-ribbon domain-containing protein [candidate division KSB1 bacterium]